MKEMLMAKKKVVRIDHKHEWEVDFEYDDYWDEYCECEDECNCKPTPHIVASCKGCDLQIYSDEIEKILNTFYK
jgi:hypothetical protein